MNWIAALLLLSAPPAFAAVGEDAVKSSVVQFFTVVKESDYYEPWKQGYQTNLSGSGVIIAGNRILTNAHVVANQVFIQVRKAGDAMKYTARVEYVAHDSEVALVSVEDPQFFKGTTPARFGGLPYQRDKVAAYGFPTGGEQLSITEGVVSRLEVNTYTHSERSLLLIQTDAAINPGNSGGPVFKDGRMIGISFQSYSGSGAENIGYIVPITLIERFLADVKDGRYDGVPALGVFYQKTESPALRALAGLAPGADGVLVSRVAYGSPAWEVLAEGDVIQSLDGVPVLCDGTFHFRKDERLEFSHLANLHQMGEEVALGLLRAGRPLKVRLKLQPFKELVPGPDYDKRPTYLVYGGLVFMPLSVNYMNLWESKDQAPRFRHYSADQLPSEKRREVVFINQVLPHDVNIGYHNLRKAVVERINGREISGMKDVAPALAAPLGSRHVIEIDYHAGDEQPGTRIVLDAAAADAANAAILSRFDVPADRSADLR
ncbi:MAG: trypsin-like peptidase domain-containing protein [Elusimicrobia bacterium]|nr:trypsin-like peptidase domain-containing protein [Elusimicrobiota bacterium]